MRSPAAAFAWEFHHRHRWGWAALACYLAVLAMLRLLVFEPGQRVTFAENWHFALAVVVPLAASFTYLLAVFSFGLENDLDARQSIYPARKLILPVSNPALAGWPLLHGAVATSVLWLSTRALALWPSGAEVPWIWPAFFAAVMLAWTQALVWMPYPWRRLRVALAVLWLSVVGFVVLLALHFRASEPVMLILLAPQLPAAHLAARCAVARARHGRNAASRHRLRLPARRRRPWASPARAQAWLEWRRHGRVLPILVGFLLPFELALIFVFQDAPSLVLATLAAVLLTPPFLATFVAATVSRSSPNGNDSHEMTPFLATRPLDLLHVPQSYDATRPTPLVLSLHGGAGWPALQRDLSGWNELAEHHGFLVAYPAGIEAAAGMRAWRGRGSWKTSASSRTWSTSCGGPTTSTRREFTSTDCPMAAAWRSCSRARCRNAWRRWAWWRRRRRCRGPGAPIRGRCR